MILVVIGSILVALEITLFAWWGWTRHKALDRALVRRRMLGQACRHPDLSRAGGQCPACKKWFVVTGETHPRALKAADRRRG